MIVAGIVVAAFTGNMQPVGNEIIESSKEAITLSLTMLGVVSFWCGLMNVAKKSGLVDDIVRVINPFINWMFPGLKKEDAAKEYISMNMVANFLGMGWAATPAGINAMKELAKIKNRKNSSMASDEMCAFLVINISSLQLIPVNVIAYRSQYGSVNPASIIGVSIIATTISTVCAIIFCKIMMKKGEKNIG